MRGFIENKIARVVEGTGKRFQHSFGGPRRHKGVTPRGCEAPLHLLYTFDTADPAFPIKVPGIRYLPLYYSFQYNAGACGYRVVSDTRIKVVYMETKKIERDFPYVNYPSEFPERKVHLVPILYEQYKTLVFYLEAGRRALSTADRKLLLEKLGYPFTQLGGIQRMWQGIPTVRCPNPSCENSRFTSSMKVFAVIWNQPHNGVFLWDEKDHDNACDIELIFQICPKCYSIHACNRCT